MFITVLACIINYTSAFYLPGVAPTNYKEGDTIPLYVNHLTPSLGHLALLKNDAKSKAIVYSYDYYYPKFHFCKPEGEPKKQLESLGSIIFGDRIFNSPFEIQMLQDKSCVSLCTSTYTKREGVFVNRNIRASYTHNWIVDGLPAASVMAEIKTQTKFYGTGFPIGEISPQNSAHFFNHFEIKIEYHKRSDGFFRVVGVTVSPSSLDRSGLKADAKPEEICNPKLEKVSLGKKDELKVLFTYSVKFEASATPWATRWDKYLHVYDPKIQWFSLLNFSVVVSILGFIIAHIFVKSLRNDITKYNEVNLDDDISEESGWKLVHADVFRPPKNRMLLAVFVGSGTQVFVMTFFTIAFALFGLLSPSNRGALSTFMFIVYIASSVVSAFVSGYLYRFLGGDDWKTNMVLSPLLVPGIMFLIFTFLNFVLVIVQSSGAIPFGTMIAIIVIWFVVSVPLSIMGSIWASKKPLLSVPVRTNQIPRQIPEQPWYLKTLPVMLISGVFPFGSIAVEMYFIYNSLWFNRIFYMFGFLFFCFLLMLLTTSLFTILMIYYTLCTENYKWHWKSFFVGGGCAIYVFLHSWFLASPKRLEFSSMLIYGGYSFVISMLVFLCCGATGFVSSFFFIRTIYSQIKVD